MNRFKSGRTKIIVRKGLTNLAYIGILGIDDIMKILKELQKWRLEHGFSVLKTSKLVGIKYRTLVRNLKGENVPYPHNVYKIKEFLKKHE